MSFGFQGVKSCIILALLSACADIMPETTMIMRRIEWGVLKNLLVGIAVYTHRNNILHFPIIYFIFPVSGLSRQVLSRHHLTEPKWINI